MRLDLVLKQSTLIKRRTVAKELCDTGHIQVNGKVGKPSTEVNDGDIISLHLGIKHLVVKVTFINFRNHLIPTVEEVHGNDA